MSDDKDRGGGGQAHVRRESGARHQVSEPVLLRRLSLAADGEPAEIQGWSLNVSRGGVRAVLDGPVSVGDHFDVALGEGAPRGARVVWVKPDKGGGCIVGMSYDDANSAPPSRPPPSVPPKPGEPEG